MFPSTALSGFSYAGAGNLRSDVKYSNDATSKSIRGDHSEA
jgi:hypothetical protein